MRLLYAALGLLFFQIPIIKFLPDNITINIPAQTIKANTCTNTQTISLSGTTSKSSFATGYTSDPTSISGWGVKGGLSLMPWGTQDTLNYRVCNQNDTDIVAGPISINVGLR